MWNRASKSILLRLSCGSIALAAAGCTPTTAAAAALADLTASTAGGAVEILVQDVLYGLLGQAPQEDLERPIAEQEH